MPRPDRIRQREALVGTAGAGAGDGEGGGEGPARREGGQGEGERRPTLSLRQGKIDQQRASRAPLDGGGDIDQSSRSSPTAEGELELSRKVARRLKWTDRAEWIAAGRDPAKWVDADVYLERTPQEVERLRESHSRIGAVAERALAQERENARRQAEQGVREAATSGDADAAVVAANRLAEANRPDPRTVAWAGRSRGSGT